MILEEIRFEMEASRNDLTSFLQEYDFELGFRSVQWPTELHGVITFGMGLYFVPSVRFPKRRHFHEKYETYESLFNFVIDAYRACLSRNLRALRFLELFDPTSETSQLIEFVEFEHLVTEIYYQDVCRPALKYF
jgi:hypothetical protein